MQHAMTIPQRHALPSLMARARVAAYLNLADKRA
jgi:hypothetical protein